VCRKQVKGITQRKKKAKGKKKERVQKSQNKRKKKGSEKRKKLEELSNHPSQGCIYTDEIHDKKFQKSIMKNFRRYKETKRRCPLFCFIKIGGK
jgi:hypothetical protein